jgi:hypothetical protein
VTRSTFLGTLLLLAAWCLAGCHASFQTPRVFGKLAKHQRYEQRAASPHGVVVAVRKVRVPEPAAVDFWSDAIQQRLSTGQGYALLKTSQIRAKTGQPGRLLEFGRDQHGQTFDYWVAVFPQKKRLYLFEAGGRRDRFEKLHAEVEKALRSLSLP